MCYFVGGCQAIFVPLIYTSEPLRLIGAGCEVIAGFYRARAEEAGYVSVINPDQPYVEGEVLVVSPPVTDLDFQTSAQPLAIELTTGTGTTAARAVRYQDLVLPQGVTATLTLTSQGPGLLRYDANGDGSFETTVTPTVSISGTLANDILPPEITVGITNVQLLTLTVSLTAQDSGSGVHRLLYSLDGTNFQRYTGPFQANVVSTPTLYVFADDNVANRGTLVYSLARVANLRYVYLPVILR